MRAARKLGILVALTSGVQLASAAWAAEPRIALSPSTVHRGHSVRVHGTLAGCLQGDTVTLLSTAFPRRHTFAGVAAVSATIGRGGAYSVTVRIPSGRRPGTYTVSGRCGGGNIGTFVKLHVRR